MMQYDQTQEAIATIRMAVDQYDEAQRQAAQQDADEDFSLPDDAAADMPEVAPVSPAHWKLGAPDRLVSLGALEVDLFPTFEAKLRQFLATQSPNEFLPGLPTPIKV